MAEDDATSTSAARPLDLDDLLHLMQVKRRRLAVRAIADGARTMRDLSERLAAQTEPVSQDERPSEHRHRTRIALHTHMPKLEEYDVVEEVAPNRFAPASAFDQFIAALDAVEPYASSEG